MEFDAIAIRTLVNVRTIRFVFIVDSVGGTTGSCWLGLWRDIGNELCYVLWLWWRYNLHMSPHVVLCLLARQTALSRGSSNLFFRRRIFSQVDRCLLGSRLRHLLYCSQNKMTRRWSLTQSAEDATFGVKGLSIFEAFPTLHAELLPTVHALQTVTRI